MQIEVKPVDVTTRILEMPVFYGPGYRKAPHDPCMQVGTIIGHLRITGVAS
jgi:hypothetical protein